MQTTTGEARRCPSSVPTSSPDACHLLTPSSFKLGSISNLTENVQKEPNEYNIGKYQPLPNLSHLCSRQAQQGRRAASCLLSPNDISCPRLPVSPEPTARATVTQGPGDGDRVCSSAPWRKLAHPSLASPAPRPGTTQGSAGHFPGPRS